MDEVEGDEGQDVGAIALDVVETLVPETRPAAGKQPRKRGNAPGDGGERDKRGRIIGRTELTAKQYRFVTELKKGVAQGEAARRAGYGHPAVSASLMLKSGPVAELIRAGRRRIVSQAASAAVQLMAQTVLGKAIPSRVQYDAMRFMIELDQRLANESENASNSSNLRELSLARLEEMAATFKPAGSVATVPELPASSVQGIDNKQ